MNLRNKKVDSGAESSAMSNHTIGHYVLFEGSDVFDANRTSIDILLFRKAEHIVTVAPVKFCLLFKYMRIVMPTIQF